MRDGEVVLYLRPDSRVWQVRYKLFDRKWRCVSTRHRQLDWARKSVRIHSDELIQATSRMFGFQRCGPDLKDVIQQALNSQLPASFVLDADGFVTLN